MKEFGQFVEDWLSTNLKPLANSVDTSVETWLEGTNYTMARKEELMRIAEETFGMITSETIRDSRFSEVKSFIKDENYSTYKYPRGINSRSDAFKVRVGPIFKLIEKELFKLDWFIKHTPADERSREIRDAITQVGAKIIGTDYSSFESLFTKDFMMSCEMKLYRYMTQLLADSDWYKIVEIALTGKNICHYKLLDVIVQATRMSGEMCTSLGNSFANLMVMLFVAHKKNLRSLKGRVEGDDGIFSFYGEVPTPADFAVLGLLIKIEEYDKVTEGSFCGVIADEDEMINITDPIDALLRFGWTTRQYNKAGHKKKMKLLRAKALSLKYQFNGCPILDALANYGLRITEGYHFQLPVTMSAYEKERFLLMYNKYKDGLPSRQPGFATRQLMEKKFNISILEQLLVEEYLNNKNVLEALFHPVIMRHANLDQIQYYEKYVNHDPDSDGTEIAANYCRADYKSSLSLYEQQL